MKDEPDLEESGSNGRNLAPKRPPKRLGSHSEKKEDNDDSLFPATSKDNACVEDDDSFGILNKSPEKKVLCFVCNKDITHLNHTRRDIHSNGCLDLQQSTDAYQKAKEKHANTTDCPICGEPLGPGPHRTAHLKSCGKKHNVSGSGLIELYKVQTKVTEIRKRQNKPHTKAPSPVFKKIQAPKLKNQPQTVLDEDIQIAKALSASMESLHPLPLKEATPKFTRLPDPSENRRKRPRSYAIVEFEPRTCKCQVFSSIHARFLDAFRVVDRPSVKDDCEQSAKRLFLHSAEQRRFMTKMNRFCKLSQNFSQLLTNKQFSDISISCNNGVIDAHRCVLHARTSLPIAEGSLRLGYSLEAVNAWLIFVYSGDIKWGVEHTEAITELGEKYGPEDLPSVIKLLTGLEEKNQMDTLEKNACCHCGSTSSVPANENESSQNNLIPLRSERTIYDRKDLSISNESRSFQTEFDLNNAVDYGGGTINLSSDGKTADSFWDCEDPLRGVNFSAGSASCDARAVSQVTDNVSTNDKEISNQANSSSKDSNSFAAYETPIASENMDLFEEFDMVADPTTESESAPVDLNDPIDNFDFGFDDHHDNFDFDINEQNDNFNFNSNEPNDASHHFSSQYVPITNETSKNESVIVLSDSPEPPKTLSSAYKSTDREMSPVTEFTMSPLRFSSTGLSPTPTEDADTVPRLSLPRSTLSSVDFEDDLKQANSSEARKDQIHVDENNVFDSFDVSVEFNPTNPPCSSKQYQNLTSPPLAHSTPIQPAVKRLKFGSHVKVLKTNAVTPMVDYGGMSDDMLKAEIAKIGLRPMARKKAIETLKSIYDDLHPAIDPSTPTLRPVAREPKARKVPAKAKAVTKPATLKSALVKPGPSAESMKTPEKKSAPFSPLGSPISDSEELGNKTLNESFEAPLEETMLQNADAMPSNGDSMKEKLVNWLSRPENFELSNHIVTLNSVDIEELYLRMMRSDDPVCEIPKKTLPTILDYMGISFSVPVPPGGRKGMGAGNGRMRRK